MRSKILPNHDAVPVLDVIQIESIYTINKSIETYQPSKVCKYCAFAFIDSRFVPLVYLSHIIVETVMEFDRSLFFHC